VPKGTVESLLNHAVFEQLIKLTQVWLHVLEAFTQYCENGLLGKNLPAILYPNI
jgi:hypothetical protein